PASRDNVIGAASTKREEPAPVPARAPEPVRPAFGGLGTVTPREDPPAPVEPAPAPEPPAPAPQVPTARPYQDSPAEELDVPDFLK
ncbi:cell division protein FtsZ, partial [Streptomyces toxytricini]